MRETTDDLIKSLSRELKPVTPLPSPWVRLIRWFFAGLLCVGAAVAIIGIRPDISMAIRNPFYVFELAVILALAVSSAISAFLLSVPGEGRSIGTKVFPLIPVVLWILYLGGKTWIFLSQFGWEGVQMGLGLACVGDLVGLGLIPGAILLFMMRRSAPTNLVWVGILSGLAVAGLGAFGSHLLCYYTDPIHFLVWHMLPVLLIGGLGIWIGRRILRW